MIGSTFSPAKARLALSMFHITIWLSMNAVVNALPRPSKAVCNGPSPTSGSATTTSRGLILSSNRSSSLRTSITLTVGESLPVIDDVDAVGRGIDAMRRVRDRDVAGVFRAVPPVDHRDAIDRLEVAGLHRLLDALDVEDHRPRLLVVGHFLEGGALVRIVAGGKSVLALVVAVGVVEIAIDQHLPGDLHRVAVDGGVDRPVVLLRVVQHLCRRWESG